MDYTSGTFVAFFAITFVAYYAMPAAGAQIGLLVAASLFFYAWASPALLLVFLSSWAITSISSYLVLDRSAARRKAYATAGVLANLALLGFFKYKFLFLSGVGQEPAAAPRSVAEWLLLAPLPIGISFYTFHGISLLVDTFRGNASVFLRARGTLIAHGVKTLLYLVFFPQLIAGPIIKAKDFYPQIGLKRLRDIDVDGAFRNLVVGYFLKCVIADNLSEQTYWISYPYYQWRSSLDLVVLLYGYSAQIFADFAGYSLIAMGLARLLGYRLPANFNFPYLADSIADFWRRWHLSLSSWLRDYLYIPLGGSKLGPARTYVNLMIVMFLGGLWHGAAWSFAVWGLWHGAGLALERRWLSTHWMQSDAKVLKMLRIIVVFNFVTAGWLLFKLQDISQAWGYVQAIYKNGTANMQKGSMGLITLYSASVVAYHLASLARRRAPNRVRVFVYGLLLFFIATSMGPTVPFIYFQF